MKKNIITAAIAAVLMIQPMTVAAQPYEHYVYERDEKRGYSYELKEYNVGSCPYSESKFYGCDMYKYKTIEIIPGFPKAIDTELKYLFVPSEKLGGLFNFKERPFSYSKPFETKLPLATTHRLNAETMEDFDTHTYNITAICKLNPYICVKTDSDKESPFDNEKLTEQFPDIQKKFLGKDNDGNFVFYYSYSLEKYACDAEKLIDEKDAVALLKLGNEHILSFIFCDEYAVDSIQLSDEPEFKSENAETVCKVFEEHSYKCTPKAVNKNVKIIPEKEVPALEYFEILSEIAEKHDIRPIIKLNEANSITEKVAVEMLDNVSGDSNCDEEMNMADAVLIMQSIANPDKYSITAQGKFNADADDDGITNADALAIQKKLLKLG